MTNNNSLPPTILDMTDPELRDKVILLTAIAGLTIEIRTGMVVSRGTSPMDVARRYGFSGRLKKLALKFMVEELSKRDPEYTPKHRVQMILDTI